MARDRAAWGLVERQHGVVGRGQLLALGFGGREVEWRVARGRLRPVMRGVYAVGRGELGRHARWMAAVLACGDGAVLSHRSAAALWGFGSEQRGRIDVSSPAATQRRRPGIHVHRRRNLRPADVARPQAIPVTTPEQTLVDLAVVLSPNRLERAVNEADKLGLTNPEALRVALARFRGRRGVARLRGLLDRRTFRLSDSELEVWFRPLARSAGLPQPLTKQWVNGFEVDFFWPRLGLVVETDGLRYHRTPSQQARALRRDQAHTAAGMTPLRFSHDQIRFEPDYVRGNLATVARRLTRRLPPRRSSTPAPS
jgi:very-short-patch-repair endonuclease